MSMLLVMWSPLGCGSGDADHSTAEPIVQKDPDFLSYWNQGLAEITTYKLEQARYGELREGHATLIFVTEPFSDAEQVKSDRPSSEESTEVLKLNFVKKFNTGIYPYSMMNSTFIPTSVSSSGTLIKSTCSSQEWCGHSFTQWNKSKNGYRLQQYSYFQSEGDLEKELEDVLLEDEIWSLLRINPALLPEGGFKMIPGNFYSRLKHIAYDEFEAEAELVESGEYLIYTLGYPMLGRTLEVKFSRTFPYTIDSFIESYRDGENVLSTKAVLLERKMLDYWNKNSNEDSHYREELGLD